MYIKVKVKTGSKKEEVIKKTDLSYEMHIKEKPKNNMANKRVYFLLSCILGIKINQIKMVKGHKSINKIFLIS